MRHRSAGLAIWSALLALVMASSAHASRPTLGERAPNFELTLFDGEKVSLESLRGQVVVINFWATWCVPCRTELPTLDAYYRIQRPHGMRVFAVATEDSVPQQRLKALFDKLAVQAVRRVKGPYAPMKAVPTNFVIDREGIVRYAQAGALDLDMLNEILVPLLRQPVPRPLASAAN